MTGSKERWRHRLGVVVCERYDTRANHLWYGHLREGIIFFGDYSSMSK